MIPITPRGVSRDDEGKRGRLNANRFSGALYLVLAVDAKTPSTMLAHPAGYIDRDNEVIVGLQTDKPFKRAIFPFGRLRMVEAGLKAAGFEADPQVHEAFTKYRKTHNDGVFDAYTPEIMRCRKSASSPAFPMPMAAGASLATIVAWLSTARIVC